MTITPESLDELRRQREQMNRMIGGRHWRLHWLWSTIKLAAGMIAYCLSYGSWTERPNCFVHVDFEPGGRSTHAYILPSWAHRSLRSREDRSFMDRVFRGWRL